MAAPEDGSIPEGYAIKGNANSMLYHQPGGRYYDVTIAEVFFDTPEHAEAAGYAAPAGDSVSADEPPSDERVSSEDATASAPDRSTDETAASEGSASDEEDSE